MRCLRAAVDAAILWGMVAVYACGVALAYLMPEIIEYWSRS